MPVLIDVDTLSDIIGVKIFLLMCNRGADMAQRERKNKKNSTDESSSEH